jgi:hypothetical protein
VRKLVVPNFQYPPKGHQVAAYVFFLFFRHFYPFLQERALEGTPIFEYYGSPSND